MAKWKCHYTVTVNGRADRCTRKKSTAKKVCAAKRRQGKKCSVRKVSH